MTAHPFNHSSPGSAIRPPSYAWPFARYTQTITFVRMQAQGIVNLISLDNISSGLDSPTGDLFRIAGAGVTHIQLLITQLKTVYNLILTINLTKRKALQER